jgi:hypothetical protein
MTSDTSYPTSKEKSIKRIDDTLTHALNMLDCHGAPGAMAVCILANGSTLFRASGVCQDAHGLLFGLNAITESMHEIVKHSENIELRIAYEDVINAVGKALVASKYSASQLI